MIKNLYREWIRIPVRDFLTGVRNLIKWFPIIWNDRDWDKHYIMEVLLFKLKRNRQYMIDHGHVVNDDQIRTITECIDLLEKIHHEWENYEEPAYDAHNKKWGEPEFYTEPCEDRPDCYILKDRTEEKYTAEENEQRRKEFLLSSRIAAEKRRRDFAEAMSIFVKNYDTWWD